MKHLDILEKLKPVLNDNNHSFLSYNSLVEEAIKISSRVQNYNKPLIVIKENAYLVERLKEILLSYLDESEIITYLPEESLRAEEIASSFENRANRLNALYRMLNDDKAKIILTSPYGFIRHLPKKEELKTKIITIKKDDVFAPLYRSPLKN